MLCCTFELLVYNNQGICPFQSSNCPMYTLYGCWENSCGVWHTIVLTCSFSLFKVSLGVILKSENKVDEMIDIMDILHQYVPTKTTTEEFHLMSGEPFTVDIHRFHHLFLGGDQLTVARVRGAHRVRLNSNDGVGCLDGLYSPFSGRLACQSRLSGG